MDSGLPSRIESRSYTYTSYRSDQQQMHNCLLLSLSFNSLNCNGDGKTAGQQIISTEESLMRLKGIHARMG